MEPIREKQRTEPLDPAMPEVNSLWACAFHKLINSPFCILEWDFLLPNRKLPI